MLGRLRYVALLVGLGAAFLVVLLPFNATGEEGVASVKCGNAFTAATTPPWRAIDEGTVEVVSGMEEMAGWASIEVHSELWGAVEACVRGGQIRLGAGGILLIAGAVLFTVGEVQRRRTGGVQPATA